MKNLNNKYLIGFIAIFFVVISVAYSLKCHGSECNVEKPEVKVIQNVSSLDPAIIQKQTDNKEVILLDVREDSEWEAGHINGAVHIALGAISSETTKELSKDTPLYVYCRSGRRAGEAEIKLKSLGFSNVRNIGGIIEWQEKGGNLIAE
jgi:rhodanese-related sulfurtransferase